MAENAERMSATVGGKRKWVEDDWDVAMAAQTFVAVYASTDAPAEEEEEEVEEEVKPRKRGRPKKQKPTTSAKKKAKASKKAKTAETGAGRRTRSRSQSQQYHDDEKEQEGDLDANNAEAIAKADAPEEFWIAQLQDDVTEDMLDLDEAMVHATWLNKQPGFNGMRYAYAYDEPISVQSILCHAYLREMPDGTLELTPKSLARVTRSLARTKGEASADDGEEVDDERPPVSLSRRQARSLGSGGDAKPSRHGSGGDRGAGKGQKKLSKRDAALHIPPLYTTVDLDKYEDCEIYGSQPHASFKDDTFSANREVIRAVVTKDHKLLKKLTTDKSTYKELSSFNAPQSVDVEMNALKYAIDMDDVTAVGMLVKASKIEQKELAPDPDVALPSHSTGKHTSAYSEYNRRAINASRGGKEGNNALLADTKDKWPQFAQKLFGDSIWTSRQASARMLPVLFPTGEWNRGCSIMFNVAHAARRGHCQLVQKVIETLARSGRWGFNDLHHKVLSSNPEEELPQFRTVSAIKQAHQTRMRPLHLAAINPNKKYLEVLWESVGNEFGSVKDDQGYEPIHYAAGSEGTATLQFLLEHRCSLFGRTKSRLTPLMCAITVHREDNALLILEHAEKEGPEVLQQVISERGAGSRQPIHYAATNGCAKVLEKLIASGADVNGVCVDKLTPLCLATKIGSLECVQILAAHGAKVNAGDKLKKTPLIHAVKNGHTKIAAFLINSGANVNAFDTSENSAVHYAASYGWVSSLELLADAGAEFWARNCWGFVPLACALLKQRQQCAEFIFERDTQKQFLDFRDRQGRTMLFLQTQHSKNLSQIEYLLGKGLNPNICDAENLYPLQAIIARATKAIQNAVGSSQTESELAFYLDAVRLLLDHKAAPHYDVPIRVTTESAENEDDILYQPLQLAIRGKQREIFELLLDEFKADPDARASDGSDAWMTAASMGSAGDSFLEKLLVSHSKKKGEALELKGRRGIEGKENFFHVVAANDPMQLMSSKLIAQCVAKCRTTAELMAVKDHKGFSPLLLLLKNERPIVTVDLTHRALADKLEAVKRSDKEYSSLVALFAEHITEADALVQFVEATDADKIAQQGTAQAEEVAEATPDAESQEEDEAAGSESDVGSGSEQSDKDEDDDEEDEEEDEEESSSSTSGAPKRTSGKSRKAADEDDDQPRVQIKFQTALHLAANRKLRCDAPKPGYKWFGVNVMSILFEKQPDLLTKTLINYPDFSSFKTPLHFAVTSNDIETVRALLERKADPNHSPVLCDVCKVAFFHRGLPTAKQVETKCTSSCNKHQFVETSLFAAVKQNSQGIVSLLLKHDANVECVAKETGDTPLHIALERNNPVITRSLLKHGANLIKPNAAGASPLHVASRKKEATIAAEEPHEGEVTYTKRSDDLGTTSTPRGRGNNRAEPAIVVALRDPKAKQAVVQGDGHKRTPIHFAARNRDLALLRALVQAAADPKKAVNARDFLKRTPLHFAVNSAVMSPDAAFHVERFLLQTGSDVNAQDDFGLSPLHLALRKVDLNWQLRYDEEKRAKRHENQGTALGNEGETDDPATYEAKKLKDFLKNLSKIPAEETDPVETVSNLVGVRGIRVNAQDVLGRTPLHLAAGTGAFVSVSSLLSVHDKDIRAKRDMEMTDQDNETPLGYAVLYLRQTTIMTLLQNHADVSGKIHVKTTSSSNDSDESGESKEIVKSRSYFYHAVSHSLTGICHMLLNAKFSRRQAIEDAIRCGKFQLASNLIVGTDSEATNALLVRANDKGDTLLHAMAKVRSQPFDKLAREIAWTLIDAGVGASQPNRAGNSALHYAARSANIHLMDFLLHNGCELNATNAHGETPLLYALKKGRDLGDTKVLDVLNYFIDLHPGLNMHVRDQDGMNILSAFLDRFADSVDSETKFFEWVEKILKAGVDPNGAFRSRHDTKELFNNAMLLPASARAAHCKMTALIRVVYTKHENARYHFMGLLLRYGAKITGADDHGNSVLMHLVSRNLANDVDLLVGKVKLLQDPTDSTHKSVQSLHVPALDVKFALAQSNSAGQTAIHFAIQPLEYGSYENTALLKKLLTLGGSLTIKDKAGKSALDNCRAQASRFVFRFLKREFPDAVAKFDEDGFFASSLPTDDEAMFATVPDYSEDAHDYLGECEQLGKIKRKRNEPTVNSNADVSKGSRVHGPAGAGEEFDALLTKVDVKNGRFGLNVFYRLQLVHDSIQGVFVVFTNWGRIGEEGKFQNTPFHSEEDAITEFKKIFKSKTGNAWENRGEFVKHAKKYNLVQRVNYHTTFDKEVTMSFAETIAGDSAAFPPISNPECAEKSVVEMLTAITDIHNLQLAATESCDFSDDLPLANQDEMKRALEKLQEIREVIKERDVVSEELGKVSGDVTDAGASALADLSSQHEVMTERVSEMSSRYYEIMPCNEEAFGASIRAFNSVADVDKEIVRLRLLIDIMETYKIVLGAKKNQARVNPLEYCYDALQVRVAPLLVSSMEGKLIERYFFNGIRKPAHESYRISHIFEVERRGESERFLSFLDGHESFKAQHSHLFWHGTRRTNLMGILSQGLRIAPPEAPHQGYAYGKGLYFANVSAKSVDYCGSPYTIESTVGSSDKKTSKKQKKNVFYMLLCEVALGKSKELSTPTFYEEIPEGLESVRALSQHMPDPERNLVSPKAGALLHLGKVGECGVAYPLDVLWAKTGFTPTSNIWFMRNPLFTSDTQETLSMFIDKSAVGDVEQLTGDAPEKKHFLNYAWDDFKVTLELVNKASSAEQDEKKSANGWSDAQVRVSIETNGNTHTYSVQRLRNAYYRTRVDREYEIVRPQLPAYAEYIVYKEAQARIRYIVEVEQRHG